MCFKVLCNYNNSASIIPFLILFCLKINNTPFWNTIEVLFYKSEFVFLYIEYFFRIS